MRIQESEFRIQKKNNTMVIPAPDSWLLYSHASLCPCRAWGLVLIGIIDVKKHAAYISAGSNIGDKFLNCKKGIEALTDSGVATIIAWSNFYKTSPVDYKDQDWFINAVVKIETILKPADLLKEMASVQYNAGRIYDKVRFGPRILDLDIILYDDLVINSPGLTIPHPRMHKRLFVLKPLCDIDSSIIHPIFKKNIKCLLDSLDDNEQKIIKY